MRRFPIFTAPSRPRQNPQRRPSVERSVIAGCRVHPHGGRDPRPWVRREASLFGAALRFGATRSVATICCEICGTASRLIMQSRVCFGGQPLSAPALDSSGTTAKKTETKALAIARLVGLRKPDQAIVNRKMTRRTRAKRCAFFGQRSRPLKHRLRLAFAAPRCHIQVNTPRRKELENIDGR